MTFSVYPHGLGLEIWVGVRGNVYVVQAQSSFQACILLGFLASNPDLDFDWRDAAEANRWTRELFRHLGVTL